MPAYRVKRLAKLNSDFDKEEETMIADMERSSPGSLPGGVNEKGMTTI